MAVAIAQLELAKELSLPVILQAPLWVDQGTGRWDELIKLVVSRYVQLSAQIGKIVAVDQHFLMQVF